MSYSQSDLYSLSNEVYPVATRLIARTPSTIIMLSSPNVALLSQPLKPLKILTIDGGGLQAISTLVILDTLLDTIARVNKVPERRPRPCDVFVSHPTQHPLYTDVDDKQDLIAGIGAGGWLALLLGRFHLSITACLSEWYNITHCIAPRSKGEALRMRIFQHCYFDTDRLMEQIDQLTSIYGTGEKLLYDSANGPRCRHVFVAALGTTGQHGKLGYNLFRTYRCPENAHVLEGPEKPETYKISRAFAVTGAAKYFTPPFNEHMANSGKMMFIDTKYPKPHNITELALDEMWGLYGKTVPISVVVNIGPGIPNQSDMNQIARRFSWGLSSSKPNKETVTEKPKSLDKTHVGLKKGPLASQHANALPTNDDQQPKVQFLSHSQTGNPSAEPLGEQHIRSLERTDRTTTYGSVADRGITVKLRRMESDIEKDIKAKLKYVYPNETPPYYRLALEEAPRGTVQNDSSAPGAVHDAALEYVGTVQTNITMEDVARRIPVEILVEG
ncbi:hypothetical protein MMC17_002967 [Xylographa soralifera]|nr:hypothetical protein [Xylographa soralifera]